MFEAEITYLADALPVRPGRPVGETVSHDTYFDTPDGAYCASGRELRLRAVKGRTVLTCKLPPFDPATGSKEELETEVADGLVMREILCRLGFVVRMAFAKTCRRYAAVHGGLDLDITVARVDFSPETFVEIEHPAATATEALAALAVIRDFATGLGLYRLRPACYTDLFLAARGPVPEPAVAPETRP
jgi:adenylate cyclase, class 2